MTVTTSLMVLFNAMGYTLIDWRRPGDVIISEFLLFSLLIAAGYVVLWFYWRGRNSARVVVFLTCLLCLYDLHNLGRLGVGGKIMVSGEAALAVFLIYWLNTAQARAYFKGSAEERPKAQPTLPQSR